MGTGLWLAPILALGAQLERLDVERRDDLFLLWLDARLAAPAEVVWRTLNDYPRLHRLSEAVEESRVLEIGDDGTVVHTRANVCVWIICKEIEHTQHMRQISEYRLEADSIPETSDFSYGFTRWIVADEGQASRLTLYTELRPAFWVPFLIGPLMVKSGLRGSAMDAIEGLEREARSRSDER